MASSDHALLDRFAAQRDEAAFRVLVDRHLDHVHSVARRITGSDDLARDVAQSTFLRLAEKAALIPRQLALPAWLHQTTRSFAINLVRAEDRRRRRELSAANDLTMNAPPEAVWSQLAPVIDELVERLPARYRDIVLFRFYHNHSHAAVAELLGLTEDTARKRATRALEKLRVLLGKRGITTTSVALASLLPAHASTPAPAVLAGAVMQAAQHAVPVAQGGLTSLLAGAGASQKAAAAAVAVALLATGAALPLVLNAGPEVVDLSKGTEVALPSLAGSTRVRERSEKVVIPATAEGRYERLKEILATGDPVERKRELLSFLDVLPVGHFEEAAQHFLKLRPVAGAVGGGDRRAEFSLMLLSWARLDLPASVAFTESSATRFVEDVAAYWASVNPQAALDWARADRPAGQNFNLRLAGALAGIGRTDLARAVSLAQESEPVERGELLRRLLYTQMTRDREAPAKMLALLGDESQRQQVIGAAATFRAGVDPDGSLSLLKDHPEALADANALSIYNFWIGQDLAAASASLKSLPPGDFLKSALSVVARETALRCPRTAFELIRSYPEEVDDALMTHLVEVSLRVDPPLALEQIPRIADEATRDSAYVTSLSRWGESDPEAAAAWVRAHPLPQSVSQKLSLP